MYIFAVPNLYSRQRLEDAEAEFLEMFKAVRQQQCRMSPLSTARTPYRSQKGSFLRKTATPKGRGLFFYNTLSII
jgi:hypothetical protein